MYVCMCIYVYVCMCMYMCVCVCVCVCNSKNPIKLISLPNPNPQIHDNPKTKPTHKSQQNYLRPCYFLNFSLSLIAFLSNIPNPF